MQHRNTITGFLYEHGLFLFLLFLAAVLRFTFIDVQGLSHDELSAWNRIGNFDFQTCIEQGVRPDMHPAFMQVLLHYWVKFFGDSEFLFRLPSTLFGLLSIVVVYILGVQFFSKRVALVASILIMFPVMAILHSTLARPYAPGLFFLTLLLYGIFKLEDSRVMKQYAYAAFIFILGAVGSIYTHYYAGLAAGILGISAFYYVRMNRWIYLILSGILSMLLFLPHWHITKEHLSRDGLGWLAKPKWHWLIDFFVQYFNSSGWILIIAIVVIALAFAQSGFKTSHKAKFLFLAFALIYVTSHFISWIYTPILREPGLLMAFPLLALGFAEWFKNWPLKNFNFWIIATSIGMIYHSVYNTGLYQIIHFEPFREIVDLINLSDKKYGHQNILRLCNVTNTNYLNYYARKNDANLDFEMTLIEEIEDIHQLAASIEQSNKAFVMLARTNRAQNVIQLEIIQNKYPKSLEAFYFNNANFNIWTRGDFGNRKFLKERNEKNRSAWYHEWNNDTTNLEFVGDLKVPVSELRAENSYVLFKTKGWISEKAENLNFVVVAERNGKIINQGDTPILYQAWDQLALEKIWGNRGFFTAVEIPEKLKDDDVLHVYFWNRNFVPVIIEKPQIYVVPKTL